MSHKVIRIDELSGEIISEFSIGEDETLTATNKDKKRQQKKYLENQTKMENFSKENGGFIKLFFVHNDALYGSAIPNKHLAKVIYLATYIEYDTNRLVVNKNHIEAMTKTDMKRRLSLGDTAFKEFYKYIIDEGIIEEKDKEYYFKSDFCIKGEFSKYYVPENYTRLYIDTTRMLYEGTEGKNRDKELLSYIYKILPYVHHSTNALTYEPNAKDLKTYMKPENLAKLLDIDKSSKLMNRLSGFKIRYKGREYLIMARVKIYAGSEVVKDCYIVNPAVYYRGNNYEYMMESLSALIFTM